MDEAQRRALQDKVRGKFIGVAGGAWKLSKKLAEGGYHQLAGTVKKAGNAAAAGDLPAARAELEKARAAANKEGLAGAGARIDVLESQVDEGMEGGG